MTIASAQPAKDYESLKRQFSALKMLCISQESAISHYTTVIAEYEKAEKLNSNEELESQREANAKLTAELELFKKENAELSVDFERSLDMAREAAETPNIPNALAVVTDFIENSSFKQAQKILAKRDLEMKISEVEWILQNSPTTGFLRMHLNQLRAQLEGE